MYIPLASIYEVRRLNVEVYHAALTEDSSVKK